MFAQVLEDAQVVMQVPHGRDVPLDVLMEQRDVLVPFLLQRRARLRDLVTMVEELDGLLQSDGNEQADDDGRDMDEEVFQGVDGFVGSVDVEHGYCMFLNGW
jgi:hypothetical protein